MIFDVTNGVIIVNNWLFFRKKYMLFILIIFFERKMYVADQINILQMYALAVLNHCIKFKYGYK